MKRLGQRIWTIRYLHVAWTWRRVSLLNRQNKYSINTNSILRAAKTQDHHVIGTFVPGMNSPIDYEQMRHEYKNPDFKVQIFLDVLPLTDYNNPEIRITHHGSRNVWMQFLLDLPNKVYKLNNIIQS